MYCSWTKKPFFRACLKIFNEKNIELIKWHGDDCEPASKSYDIFARTGFLAVGNEVGGYEEQSGCERALFECDQQVFPTFFSQKYPKILSTQKNWSTRFRLGTQIKQFFRASGIRKEIRSNALTVGRCRTGCWLPRKCLKMTCKCCRWKMEGDRGRRKTIRRAWWRGRSWWDFGRTRGSSLKANRKVVKSKNLTRWIHKTAFNRQKCCQSNEGLLTPFNPQKKQCCSGKPMPLRSC